MSLTVHSSFRSAMLLATSLGLLACAGDRDASATTSFPEEGPTVRTTPSSQTPRPTSRPSLELSRSLHDATMTEVVADPRGRAALTLDANGNVRLWPDVLAQPIDLPVALPVHEPVWMSLARAGKGEIVAGFIDTAGGARVARMRLSGERVSWTPTFEIPATEPLLELHVLDGGERILGLFVDHRIRLWNADGQLLSEIDEVGFVPWQLRIAQPAEAEATVVAVLANPLRLAPIEVESDRLTRTKDEIPVELDRGPNRNDLALTPDGKTILALQHPGRRGQRFELELVDLASGERRIVAAESDVGVRPRLHPFDGHRALIETGSGNGLWIDLDAATSWDPSGDDAARRSIPAQTPTAFALPGSSRDAMMHAVVMADRRFVPTADGLVVAEIDGEAARRLGRRAFDPTAVALDEHGQRVAWGTESGIVLDTFEGTPSVRTLVPADDRARAPLAFHGGALVLTSTNGHVSIFDLAEERVVETRKLTFDWGIAGIGWRAPGAEAKGAIVLASTKPDAPLRVVHVSDGALDEAVEIPLAERGAWPEGGKPRRTKSTDWLASLGLDNLEGLRPAEAVRTDPDPTGRRLAVVQKTRNGSRFDSALGQWVEEPDDFVVTVWDLEASRRLWTHAAPGFTALAWSGDGRRIAIGETGAGHVLDADTGATLHERRDLGLALDAS